MKKNLIACILILLSWHTQAEVKFVSNAGFIIENRYQVNAQPEQVWNALINDINLWWPKDHTWWGKESHLSITPEAGGCFCETYKQNSAQHMQVAYVQPYNLLRMIGGLGPLQGMGMHGALNWTIETKQDRTDIVLSYHVSGIHPDGFEQLSTIVDKVQNYQLKQLANFVDPQIHKN